VVGEVSGLVKLTEALRTLEQFLSRYTSVGAVMGGQVTCQAKLFEALGALEWLLPSMRSYVVFPEL
jgi:hypothetical protein